MTHSLIGFVPKKCGYCILPLPRRHCANGRLAHAHSPQRPLPPSPFQLCLHQHHHPLATNTGQWSTRSNRSFVSSQDPAAECARGLSILDRRRFGRARTGARGQDRLVGICAHRKKTRDGSGGSKVRGKGRGGSCVLVCLCVCVCEEFPHLLRPGELAGHNSHSRGSARHTPVVLCRRVKLRFKEGDFSPSVDRAQHLLLLYTFFTQ
jgi:hypothetical protein